MIDLPAATRVHQRLAKEQFYQRLALSAALRKKFVADVEDVFVENSLTTKTLNLTRESGVTEIMLVALVLKKRDFDGEVAAAIAMQNPHRLAFVFAHEDARQLALYRGRLRRGPWVAAGAETLTARGFSLAEVWDGFAEQIALGAEPPGAAPGLTIDQRLARQDQVAALTAQVAKAEAAAWREKQPQKRFALHSRARELKQELEDLLHGQA